MPRRTNRLILLVIASTFLLPLIVVWLMLKGSLGLKPGSTPRFGHPLEPPVIIAWSDQVAELLREHWSVLFVATDPCGTTCRKTLSDLRQAYQENAHRPYRLQFAIWSGANSDRLQFRKLFPEAKLLGADEESEMDQKGTEDQLSSLLPGSSAAGTIFLLDPAGRVTLYYPPGTDFRFIRQDLLKTRLPASKAD